MTGVRGNTRRIMDELHVSDNQGHQTEGENAVTRSINDELHSSDIQQD